MDKSYSSSPLPKEQSPAHRSQDPPRSSGLFGLTTVIWKPGVLFRLDLDGALHLYDFRGRHFRVNGATQGHLFVCELLREPHAVDDIGAQVAQRYPEMTTRTISRLLSLFHSRGLLEDDDQVPSVEMTQETQERFDRQMRYFGFFERPDMDRFAMQISLSRATVVVLGVGGVGSWVSWHLAAMGVGRLVLVDSDLVELSNLNRQAIYNPSVISQRKVDAASERLTSAYPGLVIVPVYRHLKSSSDVADVIEDAQLVVLTADQPKILIRRWVSEACVAKGIPWVQGSLSAYWLQVGPFYNPPATGCYACRESSMRARDPDIYDAQIAAMISEPLKRPPLIGPLCGLVGTLIAMDVVRYLTASEPPATFGRFFIIDARSWKTRVEPVERVEGCQVCGTMAPRTAIERQEG